MTEDLDDQRFETINGILMPIEDATESHEQIVMNLATAVRTAGNPRTYVRMAVRNSAAPPGTELCPDVVVRAGPVEDRAYITDPLVVIEVMSPASQRRDYDVKRSFYLDFPTIQHVVMVDTVGMAIWHDARTEEGHRQTVLSKPDQTVDLAAIGASLRLADIYAGAVFEPPPRVIEVYDCVGGDSDFVPEREEGESDEAYAARSEMVRTLFAR